MAIVHDRVGAPVVAVESEDRAPGGSEAVHHTDGLGGATDLGHRHRGAGPAPVGFFEQSLAERSSGEHDVIGHLHFPRTAGQVPPEGRIVEDGLAPHVGQQELRPEDQVSERLRPGWAMAHVPVGIALIIVAQVHHVRLPELGQVGQAGGPLRLHPRPGEDREEEGREDRHHRCDNE